MVPFRVKAPKQQQRSKSNRGGLRADLVAPLGRGRAHVVAVDDVGGCSDASADDDFFPELIPDADLDPVSVQSASRPPAPDIPEEGSGSLLAAGSKPGPSSAAAMPAPTFPAPTSSSPIAETSERSDPPSEPPRAEPACAEAPRASRAGPDGYPRLYLPGGTGYLRLSMNADGTNDIRAVCLTCKATLSRTCKPPADGRRGRAAGQGRPLGLLWAWASYGVGPGGGEGHTSADHRAFKPSLELRRQARQDIESVGGADLWLQAERATTAADGDDGEPLELP